jgi:hypothetical protein
MSFPFCMCKHILNIMLEGRDENTTGLPFACLIVSILASFCVWTKSLMCKVVVNRDSTCQSIFIRLCTAKKIEDFRFLISRPNDVSSRPDVHQSTVTSVRTTCSSRPDARQTNIIGPDNVSFSPDPTLCREASVPACIRPDLSTARPDVHQ